MTLRYEDLQTLFQPGGALTAADLLDKLSEVLTDSQKENLATALALVRGANRHPGDLITAGHFNDLLRRLADLEALAGKGGGLLEVPRLVGLTLAQGQSVLTGTAFSIGAAIDAVGSVLNPNTAAARALRVLNQVPTPGARIAAGGPIDVVLAGQPGGQAPQPTPAPTLDSFAPNPVEVNGELTINGSHFGTPPSPVSVTVDGINAPVDSLRRQDAALVVTVPTLSPVPTAAGREITVVVTATGGSVSSATLLPAQKPRAIPNSGTRPRIDRIRDAAGNAVAAGGSLLVQGQMTIEGANFLAGSGNTLILTVSGTENLIPTANATATRIQVAVPKPSSLTSSNPVVNGSLQIQAGPDTANRSAAFAVTFELP